MQGNRQDTRIDPTPGSQTKNLVFGGRVKNFNLALNFFAYLIILSSRGILYSFSLVSIIGIGVCQDIFAFKLEQLELCALICFFVHLSFLLDCRNRCLPPDCSDRAPRRVPSCCRSFFRIADTP